MNVTYKLKKQSRFLAHPVDIKSLKGRDVNWLHFAIQV